MVTADTLEQLQYDLVLRQRSEPSTMDAINTRAAVFVSSSIDEEGRTVRSCLTTEDAVEVFDWRSGKIVLETLLVSGCQYESQTVMLRDHEQRNILAIIGSVTDVAAEADELVGICTLEKTWTPTAKRSGDECPKATSSAEASDTTTRAKTS